jgi:CRISPR-associated protein Cas1
MHKSKLGHASLASDLIEDLRAPLVDKTVLDFVNSGEVSTEDFEPAKSGAIYMKRNAMQRLTHMFTEVMVRGLPFFSAYDDEKNYGFQVMLDKKIDTAVAAIDKGDASLYAPFLWKAPT